MIRGLDLRLVAVGGSHLFDPIVPVIKLQAVWADIAHAMLTLGMDHLILEGDSATVGAWTWGRLGLQLITYYFVIFGVSFKVALPQSLGISTIRQLAQ